MVMVGLGLGVLVLLMWAARAFSQASVASIKALGAWIAALAGLTLAGGMLLTGRGGLAISGVIMFGPLIWQWWKQHARPDPRIAPRPSGPMTRQEALDVLGLKEPVTDAEVKAAWLRLMRVAHPDTGGSDWLAARVNQAKDMLLKRR